MKMSRFVTRLLLAGVAVGSLLVGTMVRADTITITQTTLNGGNGGDQGQSFTPSVNDGYSGPTQTTVDLTQFTIESAGAELNSRLPANLHWMESRRE